MFKENPIKTSRRLLYRFLQTQDMWLGNLSCHAMKWRGFSSKPIHPKHLFDEERTGPLEKYFKYGIYFLDIGSGVGTDCILAKKKGVKISVGLEISMGNINTAIARSREQHIDAIFLRTDLEREQLPFKSDMFDLVNFTNVLEHLENRKNILLEIKRVKKKNGVMLLSVPNSETTWKRKLADSGIDPRDDPDHKIEYSKRLLIEELDEAGLEICSPFQAIIPSLPWNGMIAMSAAISPGVYRKLQTLKRKFVESHPEETIGWIVSVK